jgi:predicted hydrolase (HD superfamily)
MVNSNITPKELAGVRIPDTALVSQAIQLAREVSSPLLFNHVMRTYVFGALTARKLGIAYDEEVACVGAVLHDLGLTDHARGPRRFEVEGADAARRFARERGLSDDKAELIWDAVALHTSVGIASEKSMEIALTHIGAGIDVVGLGIEALGERELRAVLEEYPRLEFKKDFFELLIHTFAQKPVQTSVLTWTMEISRSHVPGYECPTFQQMMASAAFDS